MNTLKTYCSPAFGRVAVQAVDVALVMKVVEPIWATKPETASRLRGRSCQKRHQGTDGRGQGQ
jgi:hypothetical protein